VVDFGADLSFVISSLMSDERAENEAGKAALAFVCLPLVVNGIVIAIFTRKKLKQDDFYQWAQRNPTTRELSQVRQHFNVILCMFLAA
jgi:hypothetical protein